MTQHEQLNTKLSNMQLEKLESVVEDRLNTKTENISKLKFLRYLN